MMTTTMDSFHKGNIALIDEDYEKAVVEFSNCISSTGDETNVKAKVYANRALAYLQSKKYEETIADCTLALSLDANLEHAYYRKGYDLFICVLMQCNDNNCSYFIVYS